MSSTERITVTLPLEMIEGIDRFESNRSRFIEQAVANEFVRRRHLALVESLNNPHSESREMASLGMVEWGESAAEGDASLLDAAVGKSVQWIEGTGWVEMSKR
jgi:hypothetical protein